MGRRKSSDRIDNVQAQCAELLASLLDLLAEDDARKDLAFSIKRLRDVINCREALSLEDDWLLRVEKSAAQVREECMRFVDENTSLRVQVFGLFRSLEDEMKTLHSNENILFNPIRAMINCHSFVASYRLQAQTDERVVDEIESFLSNLYMNIDFTADSMDGNGNLTEGPRVIDRINQWIQQLETRTILSSSPWIDSLQELHSLCRSDEHALKKEYHEIDELDSLKPYIKLSGNEVPPASFLNPLAGLAGADTVSDAVQMFLDSPGDTMRSTLSFLVVVGQQGSGKTFLCDEIEQKVRAEGLSIEVLRPILPIDLMGSSLGETEDIISSIFDFVRQSGKCILLLDDIDRILYQQDLSVEGLLKKDDAMPHIQTRLIASFLSHIHSLREGKSSGSDQQLLIIGTTSTSNVDSISRSDKVFLLGPPNDEERQNIISHSLKLSTRDDSNISSLLNDLVDCTVGRSRSELVQYCRQAIANANDHVGSAEPVSSKDILLSMKASLQTFAPESLRSGAVSDFVDMKVLTARDLIAPNKVNSDEPQLPLFGNDARHAWDEVKALIVTPLCQGNALDELLYGSGMGGGKTVCGGVLLVGQSGVGKSALAYHCASVAASLVPSVTLIDVSCTSLVHKEVGGSERALRHLFEAARAAAPCILLMDGFENIAAVRGHDNTTEGTMDRILSTLLVELDGVESQSGGDGKIAVIGITHDENWIDPALRRPGRLEKVIAMHSPDYDARYQIVLSELQPLSASVCYETNTDSVVVELAKFVALRTENMSGAEVVALCREARMESARECIEESIKLEEFERIITLKHFIAAGLRH